MQELYLILHKVRGEAAFDIATQIEVGDQTWWIIPTSGHRAYPYWDMKLVELLEDPRGGPRFPEDSYLGHLFKNPPADLRDHYSVLNEPAPAKRERAVIAAPTAEEL